MSNVTVKTPRPARHRIDLTRTAKEIAVQSIVNTLNGKLAPGESPQNIANVVLSDLRGQEFSVVPIQQGQLTELLDSLESVLESSAKLEKQVDGLAALRPRIEAVWERVVRSIDNAQD